MQFAKQPNKVRGNKIGCINYSMCPICYGCRSYDSKYEECRECYEDGIDNSNRNYNVCNTNLHETWKINKMITKHIINFENDTEIKNQGE